MTDQLAQIRDAIQTGDFVEARRLATSMLDGPLSDEKRARCLHNLALATHRAGDSLEALRILSESFESAPAIVQANIHNERGVILYGMGRMRESLAEYRAALALYGRDDQRRASTLNNIALILKDAGRFKEAFRFIAEARRMLADSPRLHEVEDSYQSIIEAQAASQVKHFSEQPIHPRETAREPQSTRAP
jgi:tetratricopeptide (TPR) repeat protein